MKIDFTKLYMAEISIGVRGHIVEKLGLNMRIQSFHRWTDFGHLNNFAEKIQ